jgi:hypothetical protein
MESIEPESRQEGLMAVRAEEEKRYEDELTASLAMRD